MFPMYHNPDVGDFGAKQELAAVYSLPAGRARSRIDVGYVLSYVILRQQVMG